MILTTICSFISISPPVYVNSKGNTKTNTTQSKSILISHQKLRVNKLKSPCQKIYENGAKKGQVCGKLSFEEFCSYHTFNLKKKTNQSLTVTSSPLTQALPSVELVSAPINSVKQSSTFNYLPLTQTLPSVALISAPINSVQGEPSESIINNKVNCSLIVTANTSNFRDSTSQTSKVYNCKPKTYGSKAQKIRIYKLDPFAKYQLIKYLDVGKRVALLKSKNRLYEVNIPKCMDRPNPANGWYLVCDTKPEFEWRQIR